MATDQVNSENQVSSKVLRPFKAGVPNLRQYFRDMKSRKEFVFELSRAERAEEQLDTFFGQLWTVISPLLSRCQVYILEALLHSNQNIGAIAWSRDEVRCLVQGSPKGFAPYLLQ